MGKKTGDPAFLFYPSDFLVGVMFMSDEQVGKYIRLLCTQHQKGHLTEEQIRRVIGEVDEEIMSKFKVDERGLYYNARMEKEVDKRVKYTESRRRNLEGGKSHKGADMVSHMEDHMDPHMLSHIENENININKDIDANKDEDKNTEEKEETYKIIQGLKLTKEEYEKLVLKFTKKVVDNKIDYVENYKGLGKKYTSLYLTLNNWLKKDTFEEKERNKFDEDDQELYDN